MTSSSQHTGQIGKVMLWIFWLLVLGVLTCFFGNWEEQQFNPNQAPTSYSNGQINEVILNANRQHHYVANGTINQQPVTFFLDTGATDVVIPAQVAERLNLPKGIPMRANTANGTVTVYSTLLDSVTLGNIELNRIHASINPAMSGEAILLGMSALSQLHFEQKNGQLILRQSH